jgi:hypothetical protein
MAAMVLVACDRGIDPISSVEPGPDEEDPVVILNYPTEGTSIRVKEDVTSIDIKFEARDDIELQSIVIELNGNQIAELTEFKDYRRVVETVTYDQVTNGEHTLTLTATDMSGKSTSESVNFEKIAPYETQYDGEIFYMPFDASFMELVSITNATEEGSPGFASGLTNQAYQPTAGSYITLPSEGLTNNSFSATFWYNPSAADAKRAGIMVIGPPDEDNPNYPDSQNDRTKGFRLFREGDATNQTIKLNVGNGDSDSWFDGGATASVDPTTTDWVHVAFTISPDYVVVYLDGQIVKEGEFSGPIGWDGCDVLSVGSGAPRFTGWDHLSDIGSLYDELRIFNKELTQQEIQTIMDETGK